MEKTPEQIIESILKESTVPLPEPISTPIYGANIPMGQELAKAELDNDVLDEILFSMNNMKSVQIEMFSMLTAIWRLLEAQQNKEVTTTFKDMMDSTIKTLEPDDLTKAKKLLTELISKKGYVFPLPKQYAGDKLRTWIKQQLMLADLPATDEFINLVYNSLQGVADGQQA